MSLSIKQDVLSRVKEDHNVCQHKQEEKKQKQNNRSAGWRHYFNSVCNVGQSGSGQPQQNPSEPNRTRVLILRVSSRVTALTRCILGNHRVVLTHYLFLKNDFIIVVKFNCTCTVLFYFIIFKKITSTNLV